MMVRVAFCWLLLCGTALAQPANSFGIYVPTANNNGLGLVQPDGTTITILNGVISSVGGSGSATFARTAYTASGAISTANTLAVLNGASGTLAMTLANGTTDGQPILIKQLGAAAATVTGVIDGASQSVPLAAGTSGTIRDALKLRWSAADTSWLAE